MTNKTNTTSTSTTTITLIVPAYNKAVGNNKDEIKLELKSNLSSTPWMIESPAYLALLASYYLSVHNNNNNTHYFITPNGDDKDAHHTNVISVEIKTKGIEGFPDSYNLIPLWVINPNLS